LAGEILNTHIHEREYLNRYESLRVTLERMASQTSLRERIRKEPAIPEQIQDVAVRALSADIEQHRHLFKDLLLNLISVAMQGDYPVDIEVAVTLPDQGRPDVQECLLWTEGKAHEIPLSIGEAFIRHAVRAGHGTPMRAVLEFYKAEETKFDRIFSGALERCSLRIMEEIYPAKTYHLRIRLPAQVLVEYNIL
jgi:hypothetical protein